MRVQDFFVSHSKTFHRFISTLIAFTFITTSTVLAVPPSSGVSEQSVPPMISKELGTIEESFQGAPGKTLIYIQDAHDSLMAQENIAKILSQLVREGWVSQVFEEGYEGPVPTDEYFGFMKDPQTKEAISWQIMDALRIGGAEYAHINRTKDFGLIGIDSIDLHLQNNAWYARNAAVADETQSDLEAMESYFDRLALKMFPKAFREWCEFRERFNQGTLDLSEYLQRTRQFALQFRSPKEFSDSYPRIGSLLEAIQAGNAEKLAKVHTVRSKELFSEIFRLEDDLAASALKSETERQVFQYRRLIRLLLRLNQIQIMPEEYAAAKEAIGKLKTQDVARFLNLQSKKPVVLSSRWEDNIQNAIQFYETAHLRDGVVKDRIDQFLKTPGVSSAALVFGGFHSPSLTQVLREKNVSYWVISPRIQGKNDPHGKSYRSLMSASVAVGNAGKMSRVDTFYEFLHQARAETRQRVLQELHGLYDWAQGIYSQKGKEGTTLPRFEFSKLFKAKVAATRLFLTALIFGPQLMPSASAGTQHLPTDRPSLSRPNPNIGQVPMTRAVFNNVMPKQGNEKSASSVFNSARDMVQETRQTYSKVAESPRTMTALKKADENKLAELKALVDGAKSIFNVKASVDIPNGVISNIDNDSTLFLNSADFLANIRFTVTDAVTKQVVTDIDLATFTAVFSESALLMRLYTPGFQDAYITLRLNQGYLSFLAGHDAEFALGTSVRDRMNKKTAKAGQPLEVRISTYTLIRTDNAYMLKNKDAIPDGKPVSKYETVYGENLPMGVGKMPTKKDVETTKGHIFNPSVPIDSLTWDRSEVSASFKLPDDPDEREAILKQKYMVFYAAFDSNLKNSAKLPTGTGAAYYRKTATWLSQHPGNFLHFLTEEDRAILLRGESLTIKFDLKGLVQQIYGPLAEQLPEKGCSLKTPIVLGTKTDIGRDTPDAIQAVWKEELKKYFIPFTIHGVTSDLFVDAGSFPLPDLGRYFAPSLIGSNKCQMKFVGRDAEGNDIYEVTVTPLDGNKGEWSAFSIYTVRTDKNGREIFWNAETDKFVINLAKDSYVPVDASLPLDVEDSQGNHVVITNQNISVKDGKLSLWLGDVEDLKQKNPDFRFDSIKNVALVLKSASPNVGPVVYRLLLKNSFATVEIPATTLAPTSFGNKYGPSLWTTSNDAANKVSFSSLGDDLYSATVSSDLDKQRGEGAAFVINFDKLNDDGTHSYWDLDNPAGGTPGRINLEVLQAPAGVTSVDLRATDKNGVSALLRNVDFSSTGNNTVSVTRTDILMASPEFDVNDEGSVSLDLAASAGTWLIKAQDTVYSYNIPATQDSLTSFGNKYGPSLWTTPNDAANKVSLNSLGDGVYEFTLNKNLDKAKGEGAAFVVNLDILNDDGTHSYWDIDNPAGGTPGRVTFHVLQAPKGVTSADVISTDKNGLRVILHNVDLSPTGNSAIESLKTALKTAEPEFDVNNVASVAMDPGATAGTWQIKAQDTVYGYNIPATQDSLTNFGYQYAPSLWLSPTTAPDKVSFAHVGLDGDIYECVIKDALDKKKGEGAAVAINLDILNDDGTHSYWDIDNPAGGTPGRVTFHVLQAPEGVTSADVISTDKNGLRVILHNVDLSPTGNFAIESLKTALKKDEPKFDVNNVASVSVDLGSAAGTWQFIVKGTWIPVIGSSQTTAESKSMSAAERVREILHRALFGVDQRTGKANEPMKIWAVDAQEAPSLTSLKNFSPRPFDPQKRIGASDFNQLSTEEVIAAVSFPQKDRKYSSDEKVGGIELVNPKGADLSGGLVVGIQGAREVYIVLEDMKHKMSGFSLSLSEEWDRAKITGDNIRNENPDLDLTRVRSIKVFSTQAGFHDLVRDISEGVQGVLRLNTQDLSVNLKNEPAPTGAEENEKLSELLNFDVKNNWLSSGPRLMTTPMGWDPSAIQVKKDGDVKVLEIVGQDKIHVEFDIQHFNKASVLIQLPEKMEIPTEGILQFPVSELKLGSQFTVELLDAKGVPIAGKQFIADKAGSFCELPYKLEDGITVSAVRVSALGELGTKGTMLINGVQSETNQPEDTTQAQPRSEVRAGAEAELNKVNDVPANFQISLQKAELAPVLISHQDFKQLSPDQKLELSRLAYVGKIKLMIYSADMRDPVLPDLRAAEMQYKIVVTQLGATATYEKYAKTQKGVALVPVHLSSMKTAALEPWKNFAGVMKPSFFKYGSERAGLAVAAVLYSLQKGTLPGFEKKNGFLMMVGETLERLAQAYQAKIVVERAA